jgi:uncharacterized protein YecE (DUF72 family)
MRLVRIGCAGWSIGRQHAASFPGPGSHLERYARCFNAVEINSSFYRPHQRVTYARWAASVPDGFAFAVKVPREITHDRRLLDADTRLADFLAEVSGLGHKLGPLLFQFPPGLAFDPRRVQPFFTKLQAQFSGAVVCEPRNATWFADEPEALLASLCVARVAADPAVTPAARDPGGWTGLAYYRLHGAPRVYWSAYTHGWLQSFAASLRSPAWCIFDNTAAGGAIGNALALRSMLPYRDQNLDHDQRDDGNFEQCITAR